VVGGRRGTLRRASAAAGRSQSKKRSHPADLLRVTNSQGEFTMIRLRLCISALGLAFSLSGPALAEAQTAAPAAAATSREVAGEDHIRPFKARVSDADVADLRRRLAATRWPDKETVTDHSQGAQLATLQELVRYWATDYDWRMAEARLNAYPQFVTKIDGVDIHFIHVKSRHPNAMPMIITHGWPGSVFEQIKLIGPLADPTKYAPRTRSTS
jgi:hypothetical protein